MVGLRGSEDSAPRRAASKAGSSRSTTQRRQSGNLDCIGDDDAVLIAGDAGDIRSEHVEICDRDARYKWLPGGGKVGGIKGEHDFIHAAD